MFCTSPPYWVQQPPSGVSQTTDIQAFSGASYVFLPHKNCLMGEKKGQLWRNRRPCASCNMFIHDHRWGLENRRTRKSFFTTAVQCSTCTGRKAKTQCWGPPSQSYCANGNTNRESVYYQECKHIPHCVPTRSEKPVTTGLVPYVPVASPTGPRSQKPSTDSQSARRSHGQTPRLSPAW